MAVYKILQLDFIVWPDEEFLEICPIIYFNIYVCACMVSVINGWIVVYLHEKKNFVFKLNRLSKKWRDLKSCARVNDFLCRII